MMTFRNRQIACLTFVAVVVLHSGLTFSQAIKLPNAGFTWPQDTVTGDQALPSSWQAGSAAQGVDGICAWRENDTDAVTLGVGQSVSQSIEIPALSDTQKRLAQWDLVLAIDVLGTNAEQPSIAHLIATLMATGDENVKSVQAIVTTTKAHSNPDHLTRGFCWIAAEQAIELKNVTVKLESTTGEPVVDAVHLLRVPQTAHRKLLGKANGKLGPDLLGAGCYGFDGFMIHGSVALPLLKVRSGSPAFLAGLKKTDLIVGVNDQFLSVGDLAPGWNWFQQSHEAILGRAAVQAYSKEQAKRPGIVRLNVLRKGAVENLDVQLNLPENVASPQFLTHDNHDSQLYQQMLARVVQDQLDDGSWKRHSIHTALGGLALLATRDQDHAPRIKRAADWLLAKHCTPDTGWFWLPSYAGIFLSEYYLATGDRRVLPTIERHLRTVEASFHTSRWGTATLGHGPRGLPYGQKSLVAPAVHLLVFESLADRCGVDSKIYEVLAPYMEASWSNPEDGGHGGLGYNPSYRDQAEFFSRSGLLALALALRGERSDMQEPLIKIMRDRHPWFRNSHAYGEPGGAWGLIAMAHVEPKLFAETLRDYRWWFALAWQPTYGLRYTTPHMGAPYMEGDTLINNAYAVVLSARRRTLHLTGSSKRNWLNVSKIPTPISEVQIVSGKPGQIELRCKIPGPRIHYTLDGSEPNLRSPVYKRPLRWKDNVTIRAMASDGTASSAIVSQTLGIKKSQWDVVSATGHAVEQQAHLRAARLFDGDPAVCWIPDVGETKVDFPHEVILDLGKAKKLNELEIYFPFEGAAAGNIRVEGSRKSGNEMQILAERTIDSFSSTEVFSFEPQARIQFLKIRFERPFKKDGKLLMVGEIDLR